MDEPPRERCARRLLDAHRGGPGETGEARLRERACTGALMAISRFVLKALPGIDRPAIATVLPNMRRTSTYVLDLGANVDCTAEHLLQFGIMGDAAAASAGARPAEHRLLNIGVEDIKGNEAVKQAAALLHASGLNFAGNVEGNDIYKGTVDVVVCDGFVGNVALKCSEGVAEMMAATMREEFARNAFTRLAGLAAAGAARVSRPARPAALQRREPARPARHRGEEPWLGRRFCLRPGARARGGKCATTSRSASPPAWRSSIPSPRSAMIYSRIRGTGATCRRVMTNAEFAARLDTSDAWIRERTGIVQRHIAEKTQASSDLALEGFVGVARCRRGGAGHRSHRRRHLHAGLRVRAPRACCRRSSASRAARLSMCRRYAADSSTASPPRMRSSSRAGTTRARGRRRSVLAHPRLGRSRHALFGDGAGAVVLAADTKPGIRGVLAPTAATPACSVPGVCAAAPSRLALPA